MEGRKSHDAFPWLNSPGNKFFLLRLSIIKDDILEKAVSFISNNCFYFEKGRKTYLLLPTVSVTKKRVVSIECEKLFKSAVYGENTVHDDFRFQTNPDCKSKLLKCNALKDIYTLAEKHVQQIDKRFSASKFSVLYSKPGGEPQCLHKDEYRTKEEQEQFGEILSAVISLHDNTTIDVIGPDNKSRISIIIPKGFMFLFSGDFVHGGSAYTCHNVRLHCYFWIASALDDSETKTQLERNDIDVSMRVCPIADCPKAMNRTLLTSKELQDHWRYRHRVDLDMTYDEYMSKQRGTLTICPSCKKKLKNERCAKDHARVCKVQRTL